MYLSVFTILEWKGSLFFMLIMHAVVGCYKHHCKGNLVSFYCFPIEAKRWHRWISFVSRQNTDGMPWKLERDRLCSEHFILKKKPDLPNSPDYVPSVYPKTIAKKLCCAANASSLVCFQWAQWCSTTNEMEWLATEREEERNSFFVKWAF